MDITTTQAMKIEIANIKQNYTAKLIYHTLNHQSNYLVIHLIVLNEDDESKLDDCYPQPNSESDPPWFEYRSCQNSVQDKESDVKHNHTYVI